MWLCYVQSVINFTSTGDRRMLDIHNEYLDFYWEQEKMFWKYWHHDFSAWLDINQTDWI